MSGKAKGFEIENLFSALADRTRLRLLSLMADGEVCVCFFVEVLKQSQPKISRHLAYLRNAGVVAARRDGKWIHYRIIEPADEYLAHIFRAVRTWLAQDPEMKRDRERLEKVCCGVRVPVALKRAPLPIGLRNRQEADRSEPTVAEDETYPAQRRNPSTTDSSWLDYD
ncbi:MAG: metalloregulator ArsR/SmtB family transcription factor [Acidobacteria bacterium]|nr:metalloregulator ArsR/SmtB family transcription factor [Acidobacteriota bacterium]